MKVILDTCAILWAITEDHRLTPPVRAVLETDETEVCVSAISAGEIACACDRGRLELDRHWKRWFRHYCELNGWDVLSVDLEIIEEAFSLPGEFHRDPGDRIIVATARRHELTIVTADSRILAYPHVSVLWDRLL